MSNTIRIDDQRIQGHLRHNVRGSVDVTLKPCPDDWLQHWPVTRDVGNVKNDNPVNIEPVAA